MPVLMQGFQLGGGDGGSSGGGGGVQQLLVRNRQKPEKPLVSRKI